MKPVALFPLILAAFVSTSEATTFSMATPSCNSVFSVSNFATSCGNEACTYGSNVEMSGTVTAKTSFSTNTEIKIQVCVYWAYVSWPCYDVPDEDENICDWLEPQSGSCGDADTYDLSHDFDIPGDGANNWINSDLNVKIQITDVTSCSFVITTTSSSSSSSSAKIVSMSMIGIFLFAGGLYCAQRRRQVATDRDEKATPFYELSDLPREGAVV